MDNEYGVIGDESEGRGEDEDEGAAPPPPPPEVPSATIAQPGVIASPQTSLFSLHVRTGVATKREAKTTTAVAGRRGEARKPKRRIKNERKRRVRRERVRSQNEERRLLAQVTTAMMEARATRIAAPRVIAMTRLQECRRRSLPASPKRKPRPRPHGSSSGVGERQSPPLQQTTTSLKVLSRDAQILRPLALGSYQQQRGWQ